VAPRAIPARYDSAQGLRIVPAQGVLCSVLDLALGPIDLDLLGLVVHVDPINITIDAQAGGGLLGNLLCGLDLGSLLGNLTGLSNLLNQITDLLNGILGGL
jgi:hypothetical protein